MNAEQDPARALLARTMPVEMAAGFFEIAPRLLAPKASGGFIALGDAFAIARRHSEASLLAVRRERRSEMMKARRAAEREAHAFVRPAHAAAALDALRRALTAILDRLASTLAPIDPRLARRAHRAARAVVEVAPDNLPKRRHRA